MRTSSRTIITITGAFCNGGRLTHLHQFGIPTVPLYMIT